MKSTSGIDQGKLAITAVIFLMVLMPWALMALPHVIAWYLLSRYARRVASVRKAEEQEGAAPGS